MNLMTLFEKNVREFPQAPAISMSCRNETWTYSQLNEKVNKVAYSLQKEGIKKGDGVLILVPMSFELYTTLLALFQLGAVAVFIDPQSSKEHIKACIQKYPLKAFIGVKKAHLLRLINKDIRHIPLSITIGYLPLTKNFNKFISSNNTLKDGVIVSEEDPALITFTSGSTGKPKAAVRTHAFLLKQYEVLSKNMLFSQGEIDISTLPVFVLANLAAGMHSVIPNVNLLKPAEVNGELLLTDIFKYKATRFGGSPVLVNKITEHLSAQENTPLTHVYMGGGPVYPSILKEIQRKMPTAKVFGLYGSTEAEPIAHMSSDEYDDSKVELTKTGEGLYVGKPIFEIEIRIIDSEKLTDNMSDFSLVECEQGEIIVSGEHVLKGYLNGEGDKENKIHLNGKIWHRTGDAGYFDKNGDLWLLGRYGQRIVSNDKILYPFAIEASLFEQGYQTALIMHKNEVCLVVENKSLPKKLTDSLGVQKVIVVGKIPKDKRHNAKVDYASLKEIINSEL
jgi:acyl-CoA synthetase (AMP-forming)/AMP-acid ligase II